MSGLPSYKLDPLGEREPCLPAAVARAARQPAYLRKGAVCYFPEPRGIYRYPRAVAAGSAATFLLGWLAFTLDGYSQHSKLKVNQQDLEKLRSVE